jgi:hypothetical protein
MSGEGLIVLKIRMTVVDIELSYRPQLGHG